MFDPDRLAPAPRVRIQETAFRQQAPHYDARSGDGARLAGGRYNPSASFPTLYLCRSRACAAAELRRQAGAHPIGLAGMLPRILYRYRVELEGVLDLTDQAVCDALKVAPDELVMPGWELTQEIGVVAHHLGCSGLLAPSATGVDSVLVVFVENIGLGVVEPSVAERWAMPDDLGPD